MRKILTHGLLICTLLNFTTVASAQDLVWQEMQIVETETMPSKKEIVVPQKVQLRTTVTEPKMDNTGGKVITTALTTVTKDTDDIAATIEQIRQKRNEEDAALQKLLLNQKEQQAKREDELRKKDEAQKIKEEEHKKALADLAAKQESQKKEIDSAFEEMKKKNTEQQNQQAKIIADLLEQLRKKQVAEKEAAEQAILITPATGPTVKESIIEQIKNSTQDGSNAPSTGADISFTYHPGSLYRVYTKTGYITDIQFQAGEEILYVAGGDSERWMMQKAKSGSDEGDLWHLYIKPVESGIETNLVMTTTRRSYQILLNSDKWFNPIVKWMYPDEKKANQLQEERVEKAVKYRKMNFDYTISGKKYSWTPKTVWDNGEKTFIKMPQSMSNSEAPVVFVRSGSRLVMVNHRLVDGCFVIDKLFNQAELHNGKEIVRIGRDIKD